ncbi:MAG: hypothetical protein KGL39_22970 [Patescibacteria group bacterium]|nr:hypothetical protein [Patescibacteria group bacterium]
MTTPELSAPRRKNWKHKRTCGVRSNPSFRPSRVHHGTHQFEAEHRWHWSDSVTLLKVEATLKAIRERYGLPASPVEQTYSGTVPALPVL